MSYIVDVVDCACDSGSALGDGKFGTVKEAAHSLWLQGCRLRYGEDGVAVDFEAAVGFFTMAGAVGHAHASCELASMHYRGLGASEDNAEAFRHAQMAADRGCARGEALLGSYYATGVGTPQHRTKARELYEKVRLRPCRQERGLWRH
jgi:TPR repeat protein